MEITRQALKKQIDTWDYQARSHKPQGIASKYGGKEKQSIFFEAQAITQPASLEMHRGNQRIKKKNNAKKEQAVVYFSKRIAFQG